MKSDFLASAAHELRTPMVSILGFSELLIKRNYSPERQKDMLSTIHRQSGLLVKMINELLDLARIESRRGMDMNIISTPLADLVNQCVKGMMLAEGERQVNVLRLSEVQVLADPEKMELALKNILGNAFKYSPNGGHVNLETDLVDHQGRSYAVVHVQDHGIGMTPEQLEKAFDRFYRADTSGNIPGTGLGLSLVKEIADLHQGRVEMSSEFGKGTRVSLWIPLSAW
jgi:signal transduction histidine kinase